MPRCLKLIRSSTSYAMNVNVADDIAWRGRYIQSGQRVMTNGIEGMV